MKTDEKVAAVSADDVDAVKKPDKSQYSHRQADNQIQPDKHKKKVRKNKKISRHKSQ